MSYVKDIVTNRKLIVSLAKADFNQKYFGNSLGFAWAFIQPMATIIIMWFVFEVGFKSTPINNIPFILWLSCGMLPWFLFTDCLNQGLNSVCGNSFLVKKIVFNTRLLPIISLMAPLVIHVFFILFLAGMFMFYGYGISIFWVQSLYYTFCLFVLVLSVSLITSSVVVFIKDIGPIVNLIIQFGFWLTPVFWSINIVPEKYKTLIRLNPVVYVIEGYRNSFIYHKFIFDDIYSALYFWCVTFFLYYFGCKVFKKLSHHFADVM